jgi:precorrin-6B methylase 2
LNIGPGSTVADVGAGYGFLTVRLAPVVGAKGRVFAVEASADPLDRLRRRIADEHLDNVTVVAGDQHDPHLPVGALDAVTILNAYHEFTFVDDMLSHLREALKPGGRLVTLEPVPKAAEQTREQQKAAHVIPPELVVQDLQRAGFILVRRDDEFVKHPETGGFYALIVSERPRSAQPGSRADLAALGFLPGEWEALDTPAGERGGVTFSPAVQNRVITRTNFAISDARDGRPASRHDDLMVIHKRCLSRGFYHFI